MLTLADEVRILRMVADFGSVEIVCDKMREWAVKEMNVNAQRNSDIIAYIEKVYPGGVFGFLASLKMGDS